MIFVSSGRNYGKNKNNYLRCQTKNAVVLECRAREVMTIVIAFHGSGFRTFKEFYTLQVLPHWKKAFPNLVSYNRFVELMPWCLMLLCCFLNTCKGEVTGISFVDSTQARSLSSLS